MGSDYLFGGVAEGVDPELPAVLGVTASGPIVYLIGARGILAVNPSARRRLYALAWPEGLAPAAQPPEQDPMTAAMQQMRYRQGRSLAEVKGPTLPCLAGDGVLYATGEPWRLTAFIGDGVFPPRPPRGEVK